MILLYVILAIIRHNISGSRDCHFFSNKWYLYFHDNAIIQYTTVSVPPIFIIDKLLKRFVQIYNEKEENKLNYLRSFFFYFKKMCVFFTYFINFIFSIKKKNILLPYIGKCDFFFHFFLNGYYNAYNTSSVINIIYLQKCLQNYK